MNIFVKNEKIEKSEEEVKIERIIKNLNMGAESYTRSLSEELQDYQNNRENCEISPLILCAELYERIVSNRDLEPSEYESVIDYAKSIYRQMFPFGEHTPEFNQIAAVFLKLFDKGGAVGRNNFDITLFHLFRDKTNYMKWIDSVGNYRRESPVYQAFISYACMARGFFADEDMFTANVIAVFKRMQGAADVAVVYGEEQKKLEHMAGIYNVEESRILEAEQKLDTAELVLQQNTHMLENVSEKIREVDRLTQVACDTVNSYCKKELEGAKAQLDGIDAKLKHRLDECIAEQKRDLAGEKDEFLQGVFEDAEDKLGELKRLAQTTIYSAKQDLIKLNQETGRVLSRLDTYINDEGRVKQLMADAEENRALMNKIDKLMILNDRNLDHFTESIKPQEDGVQSEEGAPEMVSVSGVGAMPGAGVAHAAQVAGMQPIVQQVEEEEEIRPVNIFLDETVNYQDRFKEIMERKQKRMEQGEHFHEKFDDVLIAVLENANPYLSGPTGCGKTYLVSQLADLLEMEFVDIGYINEEYDILGFQTANGGYSRPNFYRCYKYGKIAFCDELDNGNSRATVKLNSFLSNTINASYNFPNGENVLRHPNFRLIAAGNTIGNGADSNYNTREKIEESVQQRLMPIYVGYDTHVEEQILEDYEDWFEFVQTFRKATDEWGRGNYCDAPGIITTRDVAKIKKYLDHKSLTESKIIEYQFIQTKEPDYLAFLSEHMKNYTDTKSKGLRFVKMFDEMARARRKGRY